MREFLRPILECKIRVLYKLLINMCWRGYWGMRKFEKRMANKQAYFPAFLMLSLTNRCNYNCVGCWVTKNATDIELENVNDIISQANKKGSYFFGLLGGEPFMYEGLLDILKKNPKSYFQIFTNGSLLTQDLANEIAKIGNATILISLEGMKEPSKERRGNSNAFDSALQAMQYCKNAGLFWGVATSVCKNNFDDSINEKYLKFIESMGAHYLWYYIYRPVGEMTGLNLALDENQIIKMREFLVNSRAKASGLIIIDAYWDDKGSAICPAVSGLSHHINASGDLEFCPPMQVAAEKFTKGADLAKLFSESEFLEDFRKYVAEETRGCILLDNPKGLSQYLMSKEIYDSSGRKTFIKELDNLPKNAGHNIKEIPEKSIVYRFLKKKYFFGFGAYG